MKTVFDNRQCAHVWAQQTQAEGRSNNRNMFFHNETIYSYGHHFPLATFIDADKVLINSDSYSVSTSKHAGYVRSAINHKTRGYASTEVIKAYLWDKTFNQNAQDTAINKARDRMQHFMARAGQKKAERYKAKDIINARVAIGECKAIFDFFNTKYPERLLEMERATESDDITKIIAANEERIENERKKRVAEEAAKLKKQRALIKKNISFWYDHVIPEIYDGDKKRWAVLNAIQTDKKVYLRLALSEDEIETSHGARFPLEHGIKAFKIIRAMKEREISWDKLSHNKTYHLGAFKIDNIDVHGNVKAGCHFVEWDQIERLATFLKIYP